MIKNYLKNRIQKYIFPQNENKIYIVFCKTYITNIIFDNIKIVKKDKRNFITYLKCRLFEYKYLDKSINIEPEKRKKFYASRLQLFPKDDDEKKHFLRGIIDKTKVYVDDEWKCIGDIIDEYEIKDIIERAIFIEKDGKIEKIKLGDSW